MKKLDRLTSLKQHVGVVAHVEASVMPRPVLHPAATIPPFAKGWFSRLLFLRIALPASEWDYTNAT